MPGGEELALAAVGVLFAFKGAVDGFNALSDLFSKDPGLQYLALRYHVECWKFEEWGRRCKIEEPDPKTGRAGGGSVLLGMSPEVQAMCLRHMDEIRRKHQVAASKFLDDHGLEVEPLNQPPNGGSITFDNASPWVKMLRDEQTRKPQNFWKRLRWCLSHKEEFQKLVNELAQLNVDLQELVKPTENEKADQVVARMLNALDLFWAKSRPKEVNEKQIAASVLTGLEDMLSAGGVGIWNVRRVIEEVTDGMVDEVTGNIEAKLEHMRLEQKPPSRIVGLLAQAKAAQSESVEELAKRVRYIKATAPESLELDAHPAAATDGRNTGLYQQGEGRLKEPVLVEWKTIWSSRPASADILARVEALGTLLCSTKGAEFCRPECLGLYDDHAHHERTKGGERRIGFVYRLPPKSIPSRMPPSLLELISKAQTDHNRPTLGERLQLAYRLASAVSLLHASNWIHKSLRSDNIIFVQSSGGLGDDVAVDITSPLITGFQYSRPSEPNSLEDAGSIIHKDASATGRASHDYYRHPSASDHGGWSKVKELYSLGVVLLEIAHWRPLFNRGQVHYFGHRRIMLQKTKEEVKGGKGGQLRGLVGSVLVDAITKCLQAVDSGSFGVRQGSSQMEAKTLSENFFRMVLEPLASCVA